MNKTWPVVILAVSLVMAAPAARADTGKDGAAANMARLMEAPSGMAVTDADNETIRLTPDKTKIIHLDQDAASVVVTNPKNLSVLMDSPRLLIVMPRAPGTTSFTVLNNKGQTIAEKTVIVSGAATQPKYVRIRRVCGSAAGCVPTDYYYCPDGCYEVTPVQPDNGATQVPEVPASAPNMAMPDVNASPEGAQPVIVQPSAPVPGSPVPAPATQEAPQ